MKFISPAQYARLHGVSRQCVAAWIRADRLTGSHAKNDPHGRKMWLIPSNAKRPAKIKSGRKPTKTLGK